MTFASKSLARALSEVYHHFLASLTDDLEGRIFVRDWRANTRVFTAALNRIGSPAWWLDREPSGAADDTPYVLASICPATGLLRFDVATAAEVLGYPPAEAFLWDGSPIA